MVEEATVKAIEKFLWRCTLTRSWSRQSGSTDTVDVLRSHDRTWTRSRFMSDAEVEFHELRELVKAGATTTLYRQCGTWLAGRDVILPARTCTVFWSCMLGLLGPKPVVRSEHRTRSACFVTWEGTN